jgi:hypothetical protein
LPDLPFVITLRLPDRSPRVDHHQQHAGVFAFSGGFAMRDQNIARKSDQVVAVMGNIGDDGAGFS